MSVHQHPFSAIRSERAERRLRVSVVQLFLHGVRRWKRSRAINALGCLNDSQLEDIGVSRNDIPRVAAGLFPPDEVHPSVPRRRRTPVSVID